MADHKPHLARMAEAYEDDFIRAVMDEVNKPERRLPSGWWIVPALFVSVGLWFGAFKLLGVL